jgi:hypothetical protein
VPPPPQSDEFDSLEQILEPERPVPVTVAERTERHVGPPPALEAERAETSRDRDLGRSRPKIPRQPSRQIRTEPPPEPGRRGGLLVVLALVLIGLVGGGLVVFRDEIFGHSRAAPPASERVP